MKGQDKSGSASGNRKKEENREEVSKQTEDVKVTREEVT